MSFNENLQNLRKMKNLSQEQLAEKLDVSRQAVSKWESGGSYPETDKLITICEIFECSLDELVKGKIINNTEKENEKMEYDNLMNRMSKGISIGVSIILIGISLFLFILGFANPEDSKSEDTYGLIGTIIVIFSVSIATPFFIVLSMEEENFKKKHPQLSNLYNEKEIEDFNRKFPKMIALGVFIILIGIIILMILYGLEFVHEESTIPISIFMICVTISTSIFIYYGIQEDKYNIEKYNNELSKKETKEGKLIGKICGVIMLIATIIFLVSGLVYNMWYINWIVYVVGGILCGIVGTIFEK